MYRNALRRTAITQLKAPTRQLGAKRFLRQDPQIKGGRAGGSHTTYAVVSSVITVGGTVALVRYYTTATDATDNSAKGDKKVEDFKKAVADPDEETKQQVNTGNAEGKTTHDDNEQNKEDIPPQQAQEQTQAEPAVKTPDTEEQTINEQQKTTAPGAATQKDKKDSSITDQHPKIEEQSPKKGEEENPVQSQVVEEKKVNKSSN